MTNKPLSLGIYIHIPFCVRKCNYCDFYSLPLPDRNWLSRYTHSLIKEIKLVAEKFSLPVETVYLGGGTPSLLAPEQINAIIEAIRTCFLVNADAEITMEANPYHQQAINFQLIKEIGVNRLSLGAQSFHDDELNILGRIHTAADIMSTVEALHKAGLDNFNLDLIYGLPGQSLQRWDDNLRWAVKCQPRHISAYLLQLGENTPLAGQIARGETSLLDEDTEALMYYTGINYLPGQGYQQYEISNFAVPGCECRHNLRYWQAREYLGLGPGAVSFLNNKRFMNQPLVNKYTLDLESGKSPLAEELESMTAEELVADAIILGLRLTRGLNRRDFMTRFGIDIMIEYEREIAAGIADGLLIFANDTLALTRKGYFLSNEVLCQFIS